MIRILYHLDQIAIWGLRDLGTVYSSHWLMGLYAGTEETYHVAQMLLCAHKAPSTIK